MRDRKKRNIIIGALCCLLVFMGIGYAILSQTLNISGIANMRGNWNVKITNMELLSENKTGRAEEVSHSFTDTTATFEANLYMPGDSIEYRVTVENQGNIDALLKSIIPTTTNRSEGIKFSHSEIDNTVLTAGKTITFTMKVEFLENATSIPKVDNVKYNLELVYVQYDGKSEYTPAVEQMDENCFTVASDGSLIFYDETCGTDVVVPAKVNGVAITNIINLQYPLLMAYKNDGTLVSIFQNQEKYDAYFENMKKEGYTEATITETKGKAYVYGSIEFNKLNLASEVKTMEFQENEYHDRQLGRIYKESGEIKIEYPTSNPNFWNYGGDGSRAYYCSTDEVCALLRTYERGTYYQAQDTGITDNTYYEYGESYGFFNINDTNNTFYYPTSGECDVCISEEIINQNITSIDFSNTVFAKKFGIFNDFSNSISVPKIIMPPNVECIAGYVSGKIVFPKNSTTKVIKNLSGATSVNIPSSVVSIFQGAFKDSNLSSLTFDKNSNLIALYSMDGGDSYMGAFENNNLQTITIPKSVQYIGDNTFKNNKLTTVKFEEGSKLKAIGNSAFSTNQLTNTGLGKLPSSLTSLATSAFSNNPSLTQITLTSPTDIDGWTNGSTVDGKTVVYER